MPFPSTSAPPPLLQYCQMPASLPAAFDHAASPCCRHLVGFVIFLLLTAYYKGIQGGQEREGHWEEKRNTGWLGAVGAGRQQEQPSLGGGDQTWGEGSRRAALWALVLLS